jgi:hypothetical protein
MVTFYQSSAKEERDRIKATFRAGRVSCLSALSTLLYAIATFLLAIIHTLTFVINFTIGMLTILHALVCMVRLLLVQWQEATRTPLVCVVGRSL